MPTLTFIGAGAMGEALARGLIGAGLYAPADITFFDVNPARVASLAQNLGARVTDSPVEAVSDAEVILVAVKPYHIGGALEPLRTLVSTDQLVISVAAGFSTAHLEACFADEVPVVRAMPNTPALVGAAATAICCGRFAGDKELAIAKNIFEAIGLCIETDEKLMDAVTGVSGSGPAYVFNFIEALADGGVRAGLGRAVAMKLAAQTVMGAAQMVIETGEHPGVLKDRVASPGGTTIAGLHELERGGFRGIVMDAVVAASERSREMG